MYISVPQDVYQQGEACDLAFACVVYWTKGFTFANLSGVDSEGWCKVHTAET